MGNRVRSSKPSHAGGVRVAMRKGGTLYYLLSDHLGSTAQQVDAVNANPLTDLRYKPWGEARSGDHTGDTPTDFRFTGQRLDSYINIYWYGSRWYDGSLGRFIQPDSIIPDRYSPQSWDRYSYALNNPIKFTDPDGHRACELACDGDTIYTIAVVDSIKKNTGLKWHGLTKEEQRLLKRGGWDAGSFNDHMEKQTSRADIWHDPLFYLEVITVGRGLVRAGMQMSESIVLPQLQVFRSGGESWHLGLETKDHMNIIHVGNHPEYGIHIAFGAVKPYAANFHIYLMNTFPFIRTWRPK